MIFREHNVVHMGDVFNNAGYPFIDADNGGTLDGVIAFCSAVLERIDADTTVVPGHGPVATYADMEAYVEMLSAVRDRLVEMIADGASLEQVIAARPTEQFDERYGNPQSFVNRAYTSLTRD